MEKWLDEALGIWKSQNLKLNEKASTTLIETAESFLNFQFPDDFKQLYLEMNGFDYLEWEEHLFSVWSLERIIEEFEPERDFITFSDYSLSANHIGFRIGRVGIYKIYPSLEDVRPELISKSFKEVVNMINSNSKLVY
ncbi:SMI1/KNR4 family protein [Mucilaginibacter calamicampi]|uniref:SMI1/KNR4 family protein n=1 Tax=Mucilaginibacter calamicampi TaxID=1302352 RepID=A0ABW2YSM3_9SPHI